MATTLTASRAAPRPICDLPEPVREAIRLVTEATATGRRVTWRERANVLLLAAELYKTDPHAAVRLRRYLGWCGVLQRRRHKSERAATRPVRVGIPPRIRTRSREHRSASSRRTATATSSASSGDDGPGEPASHTPRGHHEGLVVV